MSDKSKQPTANPEVIKAEPVQSTALTAPDRSGTPMTMDATAQNEQMLEVFEERVRCARRSIAIAIQLTTPSQWVVMDGGGGKQSIYATAGASDRILRMGYGMRWGSIEKKIVRMDDETVCHVAADLFQHDGTLYERFEGKRRMGGFIRNEQDLVKGAIQNMKHTAVTDILGLRMLSPGDLRELGLDLDKLERRVEYQDHSNQKQRSQITAPFGKQKGVPITELTDGNLKWLAEAVKKSVNDPEKAKWKSKNETLLQALRDEYKRRHAKPADDAPPPAEEPADPYAEVGPPPMEADGELPFDGKEEPGADG